MLVRLDLDGEGRGERDTGVGFLDHMLDLLARHGRLDLWVKARATSRRARTTRSRTSASALAKRSIEALGDRAGINRYGQASSPWTRRAHRA